MMTDKSQHILFVLPSCCCNDFWQMPKFHHIETLHNMMPDLVSWRLSNYKTLLRGYFLYWLPDVSSTRVFAEKSEIHYMRLQPCGMPMWNLVDPRCVPRHCVLIFCITLPMAAAAAFEIVPQNHPQTEPHQNKGIATQLHIRRTN